MATTSTYKWLFKQPVRVCLLDITCSHCRYHFISGSVGVAKSEESQVSEVPTSLGQNCATGYCPCLPPMSDHDSKGGQ